LLIPDTYIYWDCWIPDTDIYWSPGCCYASSLQN